MKNCFLVLPLFALIACADDKKPVLVKAANQVADTSVKIDAAVHDLQGSYTGLFEDDVSDFYDQPRITIFIDSVHGNEVFGASVVSGNHRPFKGRLTTESNFYNIKASEPGDDKHDGVFEFTFNKTSKKLEGTWSAYNKNLKGAEKNYSLDRKAFRYDPNLPLTENIINRPMESTYDGSDKYETLTEDVLKFNPSVTLLKSKDIENMYRADLEVLRNSIYARHGYSFRNRKMKEVFQHFVDWYMPVSADVTAQLTDVEKKNIALIKRYEAHATKYYDVFGR